MKDIIYEKKLEIKKLIDEENGPGFSKNIDLSGYTFYRGHSFISFKIAKVNNVETVVIKYIYITNKKDLVKLLSFCVNFWSGNAVKFIYFLEHAREANYCKNYLTTLGFNIVEEERPGVWKYDFKSTNGFKRDEIKEYHI